MPLYEYQCSKCNHRFEKIQKFTDPAPEACPVCGSGPVARLPSSPAIQFKGTGWYITDYAKKSGTDAGKTGGNEKGDGAKSDAKPESKSDSKGDSGGKGDSAGKGGSGGASSTESSASAAAPAAAKETKTN
jgi:putative FmdB family regulatory protein